MLAKFVDAEGQPTERLNKLLQRQVDQRDNRDEDASHGGSESEADAAGSPDASSTSSLHGKRVLKEENARNWQPYLDLPDPRPDQPSGEDHESRYKYYVQATKIIGRDEEEAALAAFADPSAGFRWTQVAGVAGQGKTRLAYELALTRAKGGWNAGFLARDEIPHFAAEAPGWSPDKPHLILIDYAVGQEENIGRFMGALVKRGEFSHPIRVLILERQRWDRGRIDEKTITDEGEIAFSYANERADWFERVEESAGVVLTSSDRAAPLIELTKIGPEKLLEIVRAFAPKTGSMPDKAIQDRLKKIDPDGRPLFALFYAEALSDGANAQNRSWTKTELLDYILRRNRKRRWSAHFTGEPPEIGDDTPAMRLALLATLTHGLHRKEAGQHLQTADGSNLEREVLALLDAPIASGPRFFPPLLPDLLGGWFVIDSMRAGFNIEPLVLTAWNANPTDTAAVLLRTVEGFAEIPEAMELLEIEPERAVAQKAYLSVNAAACAAIWREDIFYTARQVERFRIASDSRDGEASGLLGLIYHYGNGVEADIETGAMFFEKGADQGSDWARDNWGLALQDGIGVPKDPARAKELFQEGARNGRPRSKILLAHLLLHGPDALRDSGKAIEILIAAAEAGLALAMFILARHLERGIGVEKPDKREAMRWYREAADAGVADAMFKLALEIDWRIEIDEADLREANYWYRQAAEAGHVRAMFKLAMNLEQGTGIKKPEPREAMLWFRDAAEAGHAEATFKLAFNLQHGIGVDEPDPREAMRWYGEIMETGDI